MSAPGEPMPEEAVNPNAALNGAQVQALKDIIASVARGEIPRDTGIGLIEASFPLSREQADRIMGRVGQDFVPAGKGGAEP